jgi:hypothetical protein
MHIIADIDDEFGIFLVFCDITANALVADDLKGPEEGWGDLILSKGLLQLIVQLVND